MTDYSLEIALGIVYLLAAIIYILLALSKAGIIKI